MPTAILSVSDKTGLVEFAAGLAGLGWELVSTGGTARALREAGLEIQGVSAVTGHPEMMEGRVKTLHPAVHAGVLARRDRADDLASLDAQGYRPIDLVAVNLYPFADAAAAGAPIPEAMEQVDIGGPTLLRAAAKNHAFVLPVVDPSDYPRILEALRNNATGVVLRLDLARKVFAHTAAYDATIAAYMAERGGGVADEATTTTTTSSGHAIGGLPASTALRLSKVQDLRYGENPDQPAAFYAESAPPAGSLPTLEQLHGKALSFNNLLDIDGATLTVAAWAGQDEPVCAIIKHTTPCGVALGRDAAEAYRRALAGDPTSAFGGVVAFNVPVSDTAAQALAEHFLEVIVAPAFDPAALEILRHKKNLRLIRLPVVRPGAGELDYKRVRGGLLAQQRMRIAYAEHDWRNATHREPTENEWRDLRFAWRVVATVKSNAIVLARDAQTLGIGAGQMSRVDSSRIAVMKADDQGFDLAGAVLASDAFFPFRDGVDAAAAAGATAVVQPGGSVRDEEVIEAANEHGMAMVLTSRRVFRH